MIRPSLDLIVAINASMRDPDEFFDDEDDLDRVERVLQASENVSDPVLLAGVLMSQLARSQAFTEGNKRTALAVAHFVLLANGYVPEVYLPPEDTRISDYLLLAARGDNVEREIIGVMTNNAKVLPGGQETSVPRPERGFRFRGLT
ncbi:MAG: Fic family protein [Ferrimicrobium sp.]